MTASSLQPAAHAALRIVTGFLFSLHGFQKVLGMLGGMDGSGARAVFPTLIWVSGFLELFGGLLLLAGLFTRPVAFVLAGEMAAAYFMGHFPKSFWPILNGGELAVLYCFLFLFFTAAGAGPWSVDDGFRRQGPARGLS